MRAKTFATAVALLSIGSLVLIAPDAFGFILMLVGAVWLWRASKRAGLRR
ncbi:hypothetical protein ACFVVM_03715 [Nocardia sp. NPDC058176]